MGASTMLQRLTWLGAIALMGLPGTARAEGLDGFYQVVSFEDPQGVRTAAAMQPEGCWSRELFVIQGNRLSRGHQRACGVGKAKETCEAWAHAEIDLSNGLTITHTAEAVTEYRFVDRVDTVVQGETSRNDKGTDGRCVARVDAGRFEVTLEPGEERVLVFTDRRRGQVWRLSPARPAQPPYTEVAR